jgi:polyhydroxybutyrate depolymerase
MGTSSFKINVHNYARMQKFFLRKISSEVRIFKSLRGTGPVYQFAAIAIAALIFSSCQKEVNNPVPAPSTTDTSLTSSVTSSASAYKTMTWNVGGVTREATVYIPGTTGSHPIIFGFHGAGGSGAGFGPKYCYFEKNWSNAIVVYPTGLVVSGERRWQGKVGQTISGVQDMDLKFFDAMLSTFVNKYNGSSSQVFCHGWSSGGEFIYNVLWAKRGTKLKGISVAGATLGTTSGKSYLKSMHIAGTHDPVISFTRQQSTSQSVRTLDKCAKTGSTWATGPYSTLATHYTSSVSDPVVFLKYDGNHTYPDNVPPLIVKFFKEIVSNSIH